MKIYQNWTFKLSLIFFFFFLKKTLSICTYLISKPQNFKLLNIKTLIKSCKLLFLRVSVANSPFGKQVSKRSCSSKALIVLLSSATWLKRGSYWLKSLNLLLLFVSMGGPAFGCRARAKTGPVTLGTTSTIRILTGCLEKTRKVNVASSPGSKVVGRTEIQNYCIIWRHWSVYVECRN